MSTIFAFVVAGLVTGSVYGLAGTGLVLTYKTSGVFNFAYGALATVAAYLFYTLNVQHGMPWPLAGLIAVVVLGVGLGLAFEAFARRIVRASAAQQIAGTVGIVILVEAAATLIYGNTPVTVPHFLPQSSFSVAGVVITAEQVIIVVVGVSLTAGLYASLQRLRLGMAMRAVVDDPDLLSLSQFNPERTRRTAWVIGCVLATLAGVLIVPSLALSPTELTILVIDSFGAAAIGRFSNLPLTYVGGLLLGVASSVATHYVGNNQFLGGLPPSIPFIVLFVVLAVVPKARLRLRAERRQQLGLTMHRLSMRGQLSAAALPVVVFALVPVLFDSHVLVWGEGLVFIILFASMVLLVRMAGQISLCHAVFMAIGASTFAHLAGNDHWPWFLALFIAALCAVPIAAVLALPASRLPVLYLGLATLGFGLLVQQMFYGTNLMFSRFSQGLTVGRPSVSSLNMTSDNAYYYLVFVVAVVAILAMTALVRTRLGRVLTGLSDSPLALSTLGTDERITRILVFCISAFFAALAGGLYAGLLGNVSGQTFDPLASLTYLVLIVIVLGDVVWASLAAAVGTAILPGYISSGTTSEYLQILFGVVAIVVAAGLIPEFRLPRIGRQAATTEGVGDVAAEASQSAPLRVISPAPEKSAVNGARLEIRDVSVDFGGLRAVDRVGLTVRPSAITGLIGPNGAGKTTTFNVCSGLVGPSLGQVLLDGRDITRMSTARRGRMGLGRTFQQTQLFSSMSVEENLELGAEAAVAGASPWAHVVTRRDERSGRTAAIESALDTCNLRALRSAPAGTLSTGQRRTVELARSIAGPVRLLLLDEPSAGLDEEETREFGRMMRRITRDRGIGILIVEHDMDLVMSVCDYIYVLNFGCLIFEGTPAEVQASEAVRIAYLGDVTAADATAPAHYQEELQT